MEPIWSKESPPPHNIPTPTPAPAAFLGDTSDHAGSDRAGAERGESPKEALHEAVRGADEDLDVAEPREEPKEEKKYKIHRGSYFAAWDGRLASGSFTTLASRTCALARRTPAPQTRALKSTARLRRR